MIRQAIKDWISRHQIEDSLGEELESIIDAFLPRSDEGVLTENEGEWSELKTMIGEVGVDLDEPEPSPTLPLPIFPEPTEGKAMLGRYEDLGVHRLVLMRSILDMGPRADVEARDNVLAFLEGIAAELKLS